MSYTELIVTFTDKTPLELAETVKAATGPDADVTIGEHSGECAPEFCGNNPQTKAAHDRSE